MGKSLRGQRSTKRRNSRFQTRVAVSVDTLLRLRLGLKPHPETKHTLPVRPSRVISILRLLAQQVPFEDILSDSDTEQNP